MKPDRFKWMEYDCPTMEDTLDVNFNSIVSDLRGIIRGTIAPRTWSDISCSWATPDDTIDDITGLKFSPRIKSRYRKTHYSNMPGVRERAPRKYTPRPKPRKPRLLKFRVKDLSKSVRLARRALLKMGIPPNEALKRAQELFPD